MNSYVLPTFWSAYESLDKNVKTSAKKAFKLWQKYPFHPSLHFKCINKEERIWSVRVTIGYRALGIFEANIVTWFWIGSHQDYERFF